jgi:hypothetical protein
MKVTEAVVAELDRQGVAEAMADLGFNPTDMAKAVIKAADARKILADVVREEYLKAVRESMLTLRNPR